MFSKSLPLISAKSVSITPPPPKCAEIDMPQNKEREKELEGIRDT